MPELRWNKRRLAQNILARQYRTCTSCFLSIAMPAPSMVFHALEGGAAGLPAETESASRKVKRSIRIVQFRPSPNLSPPKVGRNRQARELSDCKCSQPLSSLKPAPVERESSNWFADGPIPAPGICGVMCIFFPEYVWEHVIASS